MFHPAVELRPVDPVIGLGLVATRPIPMGTVTWALCSLEQVFDQQTFDRFPRTYRPFLDRYTYRTRTGEHVLCCDVGRYINHSCDPNTLTLPDLEIEIAIRDIEPGEEITDDYGTFFLEDELVCACGSPHCRGAARPRDPEVLEAIWEEKLLVPMARLPFVPQPLLEIFEGKLLTAAQSAPRPGNHVCA